MKLSRIEVILLLLLALLVFNGCTTHKAISNQSQKKDSTATAKISTIHITDVQLDSGRLQLTTDSSLIITDYERTVIAEDYFLPSTQKDSAHVMRKTTTYEKGKVTEQKAVADNIILDHSQISHVELQQDSSGEVKLHTDATTVTKEVVRKAAIPITCWLWIVFLIAFVYVFFRYIRPAFNEPFDQSKI